VATALALDVPEATEEVMLPEDDPEDAGDVASEPPTVEEPWTRRPPTIPLGCEPELALPALDWKPERVSEELKVVSYGLEWS
jgi:hypothetical protein